MKKMYTFTNLKVLSLMAVAAMASQTVNAESFFVEPAPLPSEVKSVSPEQGLIDTGGTATPLGAKAYAIQLAGSATTVAQNPNATGEFKLFKDNVLVATTPASKNVVDNDNATIYSFSFEGSWLEAGVYRVEVPAGVWTISGAEVPAFTLNYEIFYCMNVTPAAGTVKKLSQFTLDFPGASTVTHNGKKIILYKDGSTKSYELITKVMSNRVLLGLDSDITEEGTYSLELPKGLFTVDYDSKPGVEESNTSASLQSEDLILKYYVSSIPSPTILPAEGSVESFYRFEVSAPENFELWFVDDMSRGGIYPVLGDGSIAASPLYQLKISQEDTKAILSVLNSDLTMAESPVKPTPGKYCVTLPAGTFSGMWNGEFATTVPYQFYYSVSGTTGVDAISEQPSVKGVYNIHGICIAAEADNATLESLPKGLYIINGKKTILK